MRRIDENVECTSAEERERDKEKEREREREREIASRRYAHEIGQ